MRNRKLIRVVAVVVLVAVVLSFGVAALAQEAHAGESPGGEIIPDPNSGAEPDEAGDRGGALQLLLLAVISVAVTGIAVYVARRSRPARDARARRVAAARSARSTQASTPPRNQDR